MSGAGSLDARPQRRALLLSGGVDSAALAALLRPEAAFVIDYGQVCARAEVSAAEALAGQLGIPLTIVRADCSAVGSGDLSARAALPDVSPSREWWPYRNQLLASLAAPAALAQGCTELIFGTVITDAFHADGRPEFFTALDALLRQQEGALGVSAPAAQWTSVELIQRAEVGLEVLGWTHSCHVSSVPCGVCRGCAKRFGVLAEAGLWP